MPLSGFLLVLTAAFCHATWNFFVKRINGGPELIWLFSAISSIVYLPLALWILIVDAPALGPDHALFLAGSAALHLGYFLLLQTGYRKGELSLVYPIARATGPLLSTAFAVALLGEALSWQMALGATTIFFGVLMLSGGFRPGARRVATSVAFGAGTGVLIGSYTAWDAYAVSVLLVPPLLLDYVSGLSRVVLLAPIARRRGALIARQWREHRKGVLAVALLNPLAYILVLYAMTFTPVAYVAPTREISVVLTVIAGSLLLKEGNLAPRLGWAALVLIGMATLALG